MFTSRLRSGICCFFLFCSDENTPKMGLLIVILSLIFMKGNVIKECRFHSYLIYPVSYIVSYAYCSPLSSRSCCLGNAEEITYWLFWVILAALRQHWEINSNISVWLDESGKKIFISWSETITFFSFPQGKTQSLWWCEKAGDRGICEAKVSWGLQSRCYL